MLPDLHGGLALFYPADLKICLAILPPPNKV